MKKFIFLVLALLLMSVTSAVAQDVRYNFAKDVDFSKFKTNRLPTQSRQNWRKRV